MLHISIVLIFFVIVSAITGVSDTMSASQLNILVLGDSHDFWLDSFVRSAELLGELEIRGRVCHVEYLGIRGATVASFLPPTMRARIVTFHPDAMVVCLGGNSISGSDQPDLLMVALDIHRLVARLVESGVRSVAVCQICRCLKWRNASFEVGAARAAQLNSYLEAFCDDMPYVFFWCHKRLWTSTRSVFRGDWCHFNDAGNYRLFRSVRGDNGRCTGTSLSLSSDLAHVSLSVISSAALFRISCLNLISK